MTSDMSAFLITAFLCSAIVLGMSSDQSIMKLGDKRDDLVHVGGMMIKEGKMMDFMSSLFVVRCGLLSQARQNSNTAKRVRRTVGTKNQLEMTANQSIRRRGDFVVVGMATKLNK
jgi:hypothetical protein